jgi:hypothetical protein
MSGQATGLRAVVSGGQAPWSMMHYQMKSVSLIAGFIKENAAPAEDLGTFSTELIVVRPRMPPVLA